MTTSLPDASGATLIVDLAAIRENYRALRRRLGGTACAAVLKADAYGLGADRVAPALAAEGCRHFFVAHLEEGIALRPHVPEAAEVFVLHGLMPGCEDIALAHRLTPVLNSLEQVEGWTALARRLGRALPAVLQLDTGMSRMGLSPAELDRIAAEPRRLDGLDLRLVMSHLACAERQDHPANGTQRLRFDVARRRLPQAPASLANSSGIFLGPDFHYDLARPGASLYGLAPVAGAANPLRPVVRLQGPGGAAAQHRRRRRGRIRPDVACRRARPASPPWRSGMPTASRAAPAWPISVTSPCRSPAPCRWTRSRSTSRPCRRARCALAPWST